jgi:hypothetical protein
MAQLTSVVGFFFLFASLRPVMPLPALMGRARRRGASASAIVTPLDVFRLLGPSEESDEDVRASTRDGRAGLGGSAFGSARCAWVDGPGPASAGVAAGVAGGFSALSIELRMLSGLMLVVKSFIPDRDDRKGMTGRRDTMMIRCVDGSVQGRVARYRRHIIVRDASETLSCRPRPRCRRGDSILCISFAKETRDADD